MASLPIWLQPRGLDTWPTQTVTNSQLRYRVPIPAAWPQTPEIKPTAFETEHFFGGRLPGEGLIIKALPEAKPDHPLQSWVEAIVQITGFPLLSIQQGLTSPPALLQWQAQGPCLDLQQHFQVEETFLYQGLAQLSEGETGLIRLYVLLAKRQTWAWQVGLSIASACLPGTPEERVEVNDHWRAGAILGHLSLL